ncbi:hypothetical protein GCM10027048_16440 [Hymenobacter coalescens]
MQSADQQALPQAAVTVVHLPSGTKRVTTTDATGRFALAELVAGGPYVLQVSRAGFQPQLADNVFLAAGKSTSLTFVLGQPTAGGKATATRRATAREAAPSASAAAATPTYIKQVPRLDEAANQPVSAAPLAPAAAEPPRTYAYAPKKNTPRRPAPKVTPATPGHYDAKTGNYIYHTGASTTLTLAGGGRLTGVGVQSTESLLHRFITDPAAQVDTVDLTKGWLNFDRVFFEPGKATLTPDSRVQLGHIAQIMRAYPKVRIKIGGYTDSTGTYKVNKLLSEARAQAAWAALVELGISPGRMDARGYGPRYAIAGNATDEGRAMNRRLSIKVLSK